MRQLRVNGTYFRTFSGAHVTIRMLFTGGTLPMVDFSSIADALGTVNKVCSGKAAGCSMHQSPFRPAMEASLVKWSGSWPSQACLAHIAWPMCGSSARGFQTRALPCSHGP